jgi:type I site-specific restriction-modification system R (restriction) subunit
MNKIGGQARAMVVTSGIERAIQYYHAISEYLFKRKSPYRAIVAFSGEFEYGGKKVTESDLNGFPSSQIPEKIQEDPYRFLICADKFQTGYDEPLLHTMYVDKVLSGVKAVQTLSRLNRAHPQKNDTFVLDFANDAETIQKSFEPYYRRQQRIICLCPRISYNQFVAQTMEGKSRNKSLRRKGQVRIRQSDARYLRQNWSAHRSSKDCSSSERLA